MSETRRLRWALLVVCLCLSAWHGTGVVVSSAALSLVEIIHDDVGFGSDPILKNLMNVGGYLTFESGATMIMCKPRLTATAVPRRAVLATHMALQLPEPILIEPRSSRFLSAVY